MFWRVVRWSMFLVVLGLGVLSWRGLYPSEVWELESPETLVELGSQRVIAELRGRIAWACPIGCQVEQSENGSFRVAVPPLWVEPFTEALLTIPGNFEMRFVEVVDAADVVDSGGLLAEQVADGYVYFRPTSESIVTNDDIDSAFIAEEIEGGYLAAANLSDRGASELSMATRERTGQTIALVMDGLVMSAPRVSTPLSKHIQWTSLAGVRSRDQHLLELSRMVHLMEVPSLSHELAVIRRP